MDTSSAEVTRLVAVDSIEQVRACEAGTLVLIPRHTSALLTSYELDVAVRYASDGGLAGLVLMGTERLPVTVRALADRAGLAVLGTSEDESVVSLVRHLDRILDQGRGAAMERARAAIAVLKSAAPDDDYRTLLARAGRALDIPVSLDWFATGPEAGEPILVSGYPVGWIATADPDDAAAAIALPSMAAIIGPRYENSIGADEIRGDALASLLTAPVAKRDALAKSALTHGFPVHDQHQTAILRISARTGGLAQQLSPATSRQQRMVVTVGVRELLADNDSTWTVAPLDDDLTVVWSRPTYSLDDEAKFADAMTRLASGLQRQLPGTTIFMGTAPTTSGAAGLTSSVAEARAAVGWARAQAESGHLVELDGSKVSRLIADISESTTSRWMLQQLISPLTVLPPAQRRTSVVTLATYLESQGSNRRAASILHLHPNAVSYRINKIVGLLNVDIDDPDTRLLLQLACRLWTMQNQSPEAVADSDSEEA